MPGPVAGMFFYLYLIVEIFSRKIVGRKIVSLKIVGWKIVGWEVHDRTSADFAAALVRQAVLAEGCIARPLVLPADPNSRTGAAPLSCMQGHALPGNA